MHLLADSNSEVDLDQENDVFLIQRDTNTFMTKHKVTENQSLDVKEKINEMPEDNNEKFLNDDMDIADCNLIADHDQESSVEETFEQDLYQNNDSYISVATLHECKECKKTFSQAGYLKKPIYTIHHKIH